MKAHDQAKESRNDAENTDQEGASPDRAQTKAVSADEFRPHGGFPTPFVDLGSRKSHHNVQGTKRNDIDPGRTEEVIVRVARPHDDVSKDQEQQSTEGQGTAPTRERQARADREIDQESN